MPVVALSLSLPTIESIVDSSAAATHEWLLGLLGAALAAGYVVSLKTRVVGSRIDAVVAGARRWIALACNHDDARHDRHVACWLTPEVFRAPLLPYQQQHRALMDLLLACRTGEVGQYWFVEGESGSGKTRTALMLVQRLVRDKRLSTLGGRCYLYDFADSEAVQDELRKGIAKPRHDEAIVMVDNFQLVRPETLKSLTAHLVHQEDETARLLLFLTRRGDTWNRSPGSDVRLVSEAKAASRYLSLEGPSPETIARYISDQDPEAARLIRKLAAPGKVAAAQLHVAQIIARNGKAPPELIVMLRALVGETDAVADRELMSGLGVIAGLAMHRGVFSRTELWRAIWRSCGTDAASPRRVRAARRLAIIHRLHGFGLISRLDVRGGRYVFHEALAELCIDRLTHSSAFTDTFTAVGQTRLKHLNPHGNALDIWLVAAEIGAQGNLESSFDLALSTGAYRPMVNCLSRASQRYELSTVGRLQLAILLNRTGRLAESRVTFTEELVDTLASATELATMFVTSRLEATHDEASEAALEPLCTQADPKIAMIGKYWKIHMRAHRGHFDSQSLTDMSAKMHGLLGHRENFWLTYSLGRMHFDALRHSYLEGTVCSDRLGWSDCDTYLATRLPTYEGLHLLYTKAHFVGHYLLPKVALFNEPVSAEDARIIEIDAEEATMPRLIGVAQRLYRRTADEFEQYGDREARYLKADILNSTMIADDSDMETVHRLLTDYTAFGESNFRSIASYPDFYHFRWHMLQYYRTLLDPGSADVATADRHLEIAKLHLQSVLTLDRRVGNDYGVFRARMLLALLTAVIEKRQPDSHALATLAEQACENRYMFEHRLLKSITQDDGLRHADLHAVFRFYPFVHQ